jgi:hypothetical protein
MLNNAQKHFCSSVRNWRLQPLEESVRPPRELSCSAHSINHYFKGLILDSRSFSKPGSGVKRSEQSNSNTVEQLEGSILSAPTAGELDPESARQERRKAHQTISTAAYYRAERRRSDGYGHEEADDWAAGSVESEGGLTEGDA